ncbi:hypothetical protein AM228_20835 [Planktothricoides sp. SR001]|nr:hypothetical protein AM228_20835 [Planktothricoides sp. SR001]
MVDFIFRVGLGVFLCFCGFFSPRRHKGHKGIMLKSCTIYMITYKLDSLPDVGWANYMNIWDKSLIFG